MPRVSKIIDFLLKAIFPSTVSMNKGVAAAADKVFSILTYLLCFLNHPRFALLIVYFDILGWLWVLVMLFILCFGMFQTGVQPESLDAGSAFLA